MKHSGKSTAGRIIAEKLSTVFIDMDDAIEELFSADSGEKIGARDIYRKGRDIFQNYELAAAETIAGKTGIFIAAAGGGICDNPVACSKLSGFIWIYIDESPKLLFERIIRGGIPAFLTSTDPYNDFIALYNRRTAFYDKLCNIKITAGGRSPSNICSEIIEKLMEAGYGRK